MIHTFELSKMLSKNQFEQTITLLQLSFYKSCWLTNTYETNGFPLIRLYKFPRPQFKNSNASDSDLTHYYMIAISVNIGIMYQNEPHHAHLLHDFTPYHAKEIYYRIYDLIPCIETSNYPRDSIQWSELNTFKLQRIDFTFDLQSMNKEYLTLINRGYAVSGKSFERCFYGDKEILEVATDNEPTIPTEILQEQENYEQQLIQEKYQSEVNYVYYKSKSVRINIYHKQTEIEKRQLNHNPNHNYDFLRIEVQLSKNKINALVKKFDLGERELDRIALPMIEQYILQYYVKAITGNGIYVTAEMAKNMIENSNFSSPKKERLYNIILAVNKKYHSISKLLEVVDNQSDTSLGTPRAVREYLNILQNEIGINPITISEKMQPSVRAFIRNSNPNLKKVDCFLPNLVDFINAFSRKYMDEEQNGRTLSTEELETISNL